MAAMTPTSVYEGMSKAELISVIMNHQQTLNRFYEIIHLPNKIMAPGEKVAWIEAQCIIRGEKPDTTGRVRMPIDELGERIGMSDTTAGRYVANMVDRFGATKELVPYTTLKGQKRELLYIDPSDPLWVSPWEVQLPEEKERTINGNECPHCRSTNTMRIKKHTISTQEIRECECCGYKKVFPVVLEKKPLEPGEYPPEQKAPQADEPFEIAQETDGEKAFQADEPFVMEEETLENMEPLPSPDTAPTCESLSLDPQEIETQAAQLLLEIAGQHAQHIEMCQGGLAKYYTVHRPLTFEDTRAHLQGVSTKGLVSRSLDGSTRALNKDADTPEEWQRLQDAAQLLAVMGFQPILIPSPVRDGKHKGGGHLWIIFDAPVDAYSAMRTLYQYTGNLLTGIKDGWPGGGINMRLPGGKYVYNCEAWCNLYDENGVQLSHDGAAAAAVLLARQTPIDVVVEYEKPEPIADPEPQRMERIQSGGVLGKDLAPQVIADFNASHSWDELAALCGGYDRRGFFPAIWRGNRPPYDVHVDPETDKAKDFGTSAWINKPMDRYQVWCLIQGRQDWQKFKRLDLAERCQKLREQQPQPIAQEVVEQAEPPTTLFVQEAPKPVEVAGLPTRMTYCCKVPFQLGPSGPECSHPECPEKRRAAVA